MFLHCLRPFALAVVLGIGSFLGVVQFTPLPVDAAQALPGCRYDDAMTQHSSTGDWQITMLDTIYRISKTYIPSGLAPTSKAGLNAGAYVRNFVIPDLTAMARAARTAGAGLRVVSAYRSYGYQNQVYQRLVERYGESAARLSAARPGHSEHQLGTTIDFGSVRGARDAWHYTDWATTTAGSWMKSNAWKFGFMMSYPKGLRSVTCYRYEPWHYRYVGRRLASKIHDSGLTLRQYLWDHFG